jgi:hypothetical protein
LLGLFQLKVVLLNMLSAGSGGERLSQEDHEFEASLAAKRILPPQTNKTT